MYGLWFWEWIFSLPYEIKYRGLPKTCRKCYYLKECRRPKSEGWKCYKGCIIVNSLREGQYEGLPRGCWHCKYLNECRLPANQDWKCKNGCIKLKEERFQAIIEAYEPPPEDRNLH